MGLAKCPHCGDKRIGKARIAKDLIVVVPCPACQEWVILFRDKVIAVSREILSEGSRDERKAHLADIIDEFFESGLPSGFQFGQEEALRMFGGGRKRRRRDDESTPEGEEAAQQISDREVERFVKVELKCLDDPSYFKRHFG